MFTKLLFLFIIVPILELYILIESGQIIGIPATLLLIILTGIAGAWLARSQGLEILQKIQRETEQGQMPAVSLIHGVLIFVGGLLLLTPGFFTDALGFSFLIPLTRDFWRKGLTRWLEKQVRQGNVTIARF